MEQDNKIKKSIGGNVQTYAEDMVKVIAENQGGIIKKIIDEQEKKEIEKKNMSPISSKNKLFLILSLVLIVFTLALSLFLFLRIKNQTVEVSSPNVELVPIIFTDGVALTEIGGFKKEKIVKDILQKIDISEIKVGNVVGIYPTAGGKIIGLRKFLTLIESSFVPGATNLVSDNFLMGVFNQGNNKDLFLLFKARSFVDIFPIMRGWEDKMFSDLYGFFRINVNSDTGYLLTKSFEDGIVGNKNARVLYDNSGNIVLMYVFADEQSVIISDNLDSVGEIMRRLAGSQIRK